jgi:hypothetical protein
MTIWRMRIACWIPKAKDTVSDYVLRITFPLQQWFHESASILRDTYIACLADNIYSNNNVTVLHKNMYNHKSNLLHVSASFDHHQGGIPQRKTHYWLIMAWSCKWKVSGEWCQVKVIKNCSADCIYIGYTWKFIIRMQTHISIFCGCLCHRGWVLTQIKLNDMRCVLLHVW